MNHKQRPTTTASYKDDLESRGDIIVLNHIDINQVLKSFAVTLMQKLLQYLSQLSRRISKSKPTQVRKR